LIPHFGGRQSQHALYPRGTGEDLNIKKVKIMWKSKIVNKLLFMAKNGKTIKNFCNKMRNLLGDNLVFVKLFGSQIRGEAVSESDIDIIIVLKNRDLEICDEIYTILFNVDPYYEHKISLSIFSEEEYLENERLGSFFVENINREAVEI